MLCVLTLNCHRAYRARALEEFLRTTLESGRYDIILLQEASAPVKEIIARVRSAYIVYDAPCRHGLSEACIVTKFPASGVEFLSFGGLSGALIAQVKIAGRSWQVCSAHLPYGWHVVRRHRSLVVLKRRLVGELPTIVGGDFNVMFVGENRLMVERLRPEFVHGTVYSTYSHDTALLHTFSFLPAVFVFLGRFGVRLLTRLDHVFVDARTAGVSTWESRVLELVVSDHRPVEFVLHDKAVR